MYMVFCCLRFFQCVNTPDLRLATVSHLSIVTVIVKFVYPFFHIDLGYLLHFCSLMQHKIAVM